MEAVKTTRKLAFCSCCQTVSFGSAAGSCVGGGVAVGFGVAVDGCGVIVLIAGMVAVSVGAG